MKRFRKKSAWDKVKDPVVSRAPDKSTLRSGALAAGATVALAAASSVVSSIRRKNDS